MKPYVQHDSDNVENNIVVKAMIVDDNNESSHLEGEVHNDFLFS